MWFSINPYWMYVTYAPILFRVTSLAFDQSDAKAPVHLNAENMAKIDNYLPKATCEEALTLNTFPGGPLLKWNYLNSSMDK